MPSTSTSSTSNGAPPVSTATEQQARVIIEAQDVHKTYATGAVQVHALRGVNLEIRSGEIVSIMGPSGCGKTTLLNVLSGIDDISQGKVLIEGSSIHEMSDRARTRYRAERMGFIFQSFNLLPVLSTVENVELPLLLVGVRPGNARKRAEESLAMVGLADQARQRPAELSGGQQQRVAIARALVNNPAIVWADEPTGNLDSSMAGQVVELIERLNREQNQTFVLVTHDPNVGHAGDRILQMEDGMIIEDQHNSGRNHAAFAGTAVTAH